MKTRLLLLSLASLTLGLVPLARAADADSAPATNQPAVTDRDDASTTDSARSETPGQYVDDAAITAKVKTAIFRDGTLHPTQIHVTTEHGVVELSGVVDTRAQKSQAEEIAEQVPGVRSVSNQLTVR